MNSTKECMASKMEEGQGLKSQSFAVSCVFEWRDNGEMAKEVIRKGTQLLPRLVLSF